MIITIIIIIIIIIIITIIIIIIIINFRFKSTIFNSWRSRYNCGTTKHWKL